ncbi:phosphatidylglycerophosphate phosphatase PTPMT2-like isoform X1 [Musa acuminata AAA Group]|uniref:phosphatidylglycerophosphate phosphatase PTPMT2-like isoform X1 n=2 Tax=Musa acuminata AAA Group TaxID=214697 RepID=UPI0031D739CC
MDGRVQRYLRPPIVIWLFLVVPFIEDSRKIGGIHDRDRNPLRPSFRSRDSNLGSRSIMRIEEPNEGGSEDSDGGKLVTVRAKRALVGAGARVLFYPTLMYNVLRNKIQAEFRWWDEVDQFILLGAVPFRKDVPRLQQLGVRGVITLNEPYETLVPSSLYKVHGIDHLVVPTTDYLFAPSLVDICLAVDFIHRNASHGRTTYVHCKAGRGRSTTIVLCYLIEYKNMTPVAALEYVRSRRPRVLLAPSQWQAVQEYSKRKLEFPAIQWPKPTYSLTGDEVLVTAHDLEGYSTEDDKDQGMSSCKAPQTSTLLGEDEVLITDADLQGYEAFRVACDEKRVLSNQNIRTPLMMRKLSCLFPFLKFSGGKQPIARALPAVHAC